MGWCVRGRRGRKWWWRGRKVSVNREGGSGDGGGKW